ncbi:hypothetical protein GCM10010464_54740 [Pseudonocardia yunnanensis]|uniref:MFS transporter n=1 Tax=Pseudonocardia yunnanensis TaxID=58107 RepID=A0ABW4FC45_9PSEU
MGLVYPSVTTLALAQTADERKGATSGSLQLSETLSVAVMIGAAGTIVAISDRVQWNEGNAQIAVFAATALAGIAAAAGRLENRGPQR